MPQRVAVWLRLAPGRRGRGPLKLRPSPTRLSDGRIAGVLKKSPKHAVIKELDGWDRNRLPAPARECGPKLRPAGRELKIPK